MLERTKSVLMQELSGCGPLMMALHCIDRFFGADVERLQKGRVPRVNGSVAVIPVQGPITYFDSWYGVNIRRVADAVRAAKSEKRIKGVVLHVDSPGGFAYGTQEAANELFAMRDSKPMVSIADPMMASAALYFGAAADKVYATPSGDVGSIGTMQMHMDLSEMLANDGVKVEFIHAGRNKVEGNKYQPLSADARAYYQSEVDEINSHFVGDLAKFRGVSKSVSGGETWGEGRTLTATRAASVGMIDGVLTLSELLTKMGADPSNARTRSNDAALTETLQAAWNDGAIVQASDAQQQDADSVAAYQWRKKSKLTVDN